MDATDRRSAITDEATRWWTSLGMRMPDEVSVEDRKRFTCWLRESPLHVSEFLHVAHVHDSLGRFKLWGEVSTKEFAAEGAEIVELDVRSHSGSVHGEDDVKRWKHWAAAAAVAVIAIAGVWALSGLHDQTVATDRAERREVMLSDGSLVQLEPQTRLRVRFADERRHITLEQGRALFRVAKDSRRPFQVQADRALVRAVGTAFGVERKPLGIVVTVAEGKVAITTANDGGAAVSQTVSTSSTLLVADQQVTVAFAVSEKRKGTSTVRGETLHRPVKQVDAARALAWAQGRLVFDSTPLADVIEEFNRYNHVELRVSDAELARRPVSGVFQASDPETLVAFVQAGAQVQVTRRGGREIRIDPVAPESIQSR
jgi:transmembrane sensor